MPWEADSVVDAGRGARFFSQAVRSSLVLYTGLRHEPISKDMVARLVCIIGVTIASRMIGVIGGHVAVAG